MSTKNLTQNPYGTVSIEPKGEFIAGKWISSMVKPNVFF